MKAIFKNMIQAYQGKCDGLVYYYNPRLNRIVVRPHVIPRPSAQTRRFASIAANLKALNPSKGFKNDLSVYVDIHNRKASNHRRPMNNWCNAYNKMMYALAKMYVGVDDGEGGINWIPASAGMTGEGMELDLATLTRDIIFDNDLPCITVKRAVEAGLLSTVKGYELLTAEM